MHDIDPLLTAARVRALCGNITDMTLSRWLEKGKFPPPSKRINRNRYWRSSVVAEWLDAPSAVAA